MTVQVEKLIGVVQVDSKAAQLQMLAFKGAMVAVANSGVQALAGAGVAMTAALSPAVGLLGTIPGLAAAGIASAAGLMTVFSGVGDALKAQTAATEASNVVGRQATDVARSRRAAMWSLEDSVMAVREAEKQLAEVMKPAKAIDVREAELGLRSARLEQAAATADAAKAERDYAIAKQNTYKAVTGIVDEFTGKTLEFVTEVKGDTTDPLQIARQREAAAIRIESAEIGVLRAQEQIIELAKKGTSQDESVIASKRALESAMRGMTVAQEQMNDAAVQGGEQAIAATDEQAKAFAKLAPAAQEFVRLLGDQKMWWGELKKESQQEFFIPLNEGFRSVLNNSGVFKEEMVDTASVLGMLGKEAGELFGSGSFGEDFRRIMSMNETTIRRGGEAILALVGGVTDLMVVGKPMLDWLSRGTLEWSRNVEQWFAAGRASGELNEKLNRSMDVLDGLQDTAMDYAGALKEIGIQSAPLGGWILDSTRKNAKAMKDWTKEADNQKKMRAYFDSFKEPLGEASALIKDVAIGLVELNDPKQLATIISQLRTDLLPTLLEIGGALQDSGMIEALIPVLSKGADLIYTMVGATGALTTGLELLEPILETINNLLELPGIGTGVGTLLTMVAAWKLVGTASSAALGIVGRSAVMTAALNNLGSMSVATRYLGQNVRDLRANIASGQGVAAATRTFGADIRGTVTSMGMMNAAMIGAGGILFAMTIFNNKLREAKQEASAAGTEIANMIGDNVSSGDYDKVRSQLEQTQAEIMSMNDTIENSRAPWDKIERDSMREFANTLSTEVMNKYAPLVNMSDQLAQATGANTSATDEFIFKQAELGRTFDTAREATIEYNKEQKRLAEEGRQQNLDKIREEIDAQEDLRRSRLTGQAAIDDYNKQLANANLDGIITPEEAADIESAYQRAYDAAIQNAEGLVRLAGENATAEEKSALLRGELMRQVATLEEGSPLRIALVDYTSALGEIPTEIKTAYSNENLDAEYFKAASYSVLLQSIKRQQADLVGSLVMDAFQALPPELTKEEQIAQMLENFRLGSESWTKEGFNGKRAMGGPVKAGKAYLVGENGPEPFIPDQDGYIVPNHKYESMGGMSEEKFIDALRQAMQSLRPINATFNNHEDPEQVARALAWSY